MRKIDSQKWGVIIALKRVKKSIDKIKRSAEQIVKEKSGERATQTEKKPTVFVILD